MMNTAASRGSFKLLAARILAVLFVVAAIVLGYLHWHREEQNPMSGEAVLQADLLHVSTPVPGRLKSLSVEEGSLVQPGQVVFTLDDESYRLQVETARAQLKMAEAALSANERAVRAETSNVQVADQQVARARANLALAEQTVARLEPLARKGYVTAQQLDDARTLRANAAAGLAQAQAAASAATSLVGDLEGTRAAVEAQRSVLALAERALADTQVTVQHAGRVVGLNVTTGEYLAPDQSLFTLVVTDKWYASAFFRESELPKIRDGMCATVFVMSAQNQPLRGKVVNIGWGVTSTSQLSIPRGLPYVPKSLDWVRVAQRFPVRVEIQNPPAELMRVGASAIVRLHQQGEC